MQSRMRSVLYLKNNFHVLNLLLFLLIVLLSALLLHAYHQNSEPQGRGARKHTQPAEQQAGAATTSPSPVDYAAISNQNLFHPERRIPPEKKEAKPLPRPDVVLYGTIVSADLNLAYVEDKKAPKSTPGRGVRQVVLKKGDGLSGFVLKEIEKDRIVLVRDGEIMTVYLSDSKKRGSATVKAEGTAPPSHVLAPTRPVPWQPPPPSPPKRQKSVSSSVSQIPGS